MIHCLATVRACPPEKCRNLGDGRKIVGVIPARARRKQKGNIVTKPITGRLLVRIQSQEQMPRVFKLGAFCFSELICDGGSMRLFGHELSTSWVLLIIVVAYWVFSGIGAWWLRRRQSAERRRVDERPCRPREAEAQKTLPRPSMPRSKGEREDRWLDNIQSRARAWKRWNETPRDASDDMRIVTATSLWELPRKAPPSPNGLPCQSAGQGDTWTGPLRRDARHPHGRG